MSPVVVVKDYGGYVDQYAAVTEMYRRTNREVRIHECHSACTMALSLPNVCVYPNSVFKFHQAYDPRNHVTNWSVSDELFNTYPLAVRERLGTLTKQFTILRGDELIALGVRECGEPQPRIMMAKATQAPLPQGGDSTFSMLAGRLGGIVPSLGVKAVPTVPDAAVRKALPSLPDGVLQAKIPLPPQKPADLATPDPVETASIPPDGGVPLPPPRPRLVVASAPGLPPMPMLRMIGGAQTILPAHFVPFPKQAT